MEMVLLALAVEYGLLGAWKLGSRALRPSDAKRLLARTVELVGDGLVADGGDQRMVELLQRSLRDWLSAHSPRPVLPASVGLTGEDGMRAALVAHLRPLFDGHTFDVGRGSRVDGARMLERLGMDLDGLAARVVAACRTALGELAIGDGGLPELRSQVADEDTHRMLGQLGEKVGRLDEKVAAGRDSVTTSATEAAIGPDLVGAMPHEAAALRTRQKLFKRLCSAVEGARAATVSVLVGPPGVGKAQLAAAYARRQRAAGRPVFWINAESEEHLIADYSAIGEAWGLRIVGETTDETATRVRRWLRGRQEPCLLVLDNVTNAKVVQAWTSPGVGAARWVVTTTERPVARVGRRIDVDVFEPPEARGYLAARLGRTS